jgi:predicted RNase H-like nuclease
MANAVGVDWAGNGWVAASVDAGEPTVEFFPTMLNLWRHHRNANLILIDIPIGLRESGKRACDRSVKDELGGSRHGSVFLTPTREAVYAPNIEAAKARQDPADFSVQNQVWAIVPRIRELDGFLREFAAEVRNDQILEAHPELCFAGFNGGTPIEASKSTEAGRDARLAVLESVDPDLVEAYEAGVERLTEPSYAPMIGASKTDDIVDALVLAATAAHGVDQLTRLPAEPERDPVLDRPIEIVYFQQE